MSAGAERVLQRCDALAEITAIPGRIDRFHLTAEHQRANAVVAKWMSEAGMATWTDAAGNQCGRLEGADPSAPALLLGSHIDTVPNAGRYDGPLGVVMAIEVVSRLAAQGPPARPVEVIAFSDEEGTRFSTALLGSRAVAGTWQPEMLDAVDAQGVSLRQALTDFGLDPGRMGDAARHPDDVYAYLEAHIEQGPELESAGYALGVVSSIAGARRFQLATLGEARHAGGTPYRRRRDALIGAARAVLDIEDVARRRDVIATVGQMQAFPGGVNVVPGKVEFSLDLRAESDTNRDDAWEEILDLMTSHCVGRSLELVVEQTHQAPAISCAQWLCDAVAAGITSTGQKQAPVLLSPAGHDAMAMAAITDIGMLFVRCADGISHHPDEDVISDDVAVGIDAFEHTVRHVLTVDTVTE